MALNVNALLMEALRRRDEWLVIQGRIADESAVLDWTEAGAARRESLRADAAYAPVVALVDGVNCVAEILDGTLLSAFDGYRILYDLLERKLLRDLPLEETFAVGQRLAAEGDVDRALPLLERAARLAPDDPGVQETIAQALAGAERVDAAVAAWRQAAERRLAAGQPEAAVADWQQAIHLAPHVPDLRLALVRGLVAAGKPEEAYAEAEMFLKNLASSSGGSGVLPALCETILQVKPQDLTFRCALARAHAAKGNAEGARAELRTALRHVAPADPHRARRYREMLTILPDFAEAREALQQAQMTSGQRRRRRLLRVAPPLVLLVLLGIGAAGYWHEDRVRTRYDAAVRDAAAHREAGRFQEATRALQHARQQAPFTLLHAGRLDAEEARLNEAIARRRKEATNRLAETVTALHQRIQKADALAEAGSVAEAIGMYRAIAEEAKQLPPSAAGDLESDAQARAAEAQGFLRDAQELNETAARLEREGKYAEACRAVAALARRFPRLPQTRQCTFPLHVQSAPPGASITLDGADTRLKTPAVVRLPLQGPVRLGLRRHGFESVEMELAETGIGTLQAPVEMKKTYAWRRATGGVIEGAAAVAAPLVLIGSSDGHVYAVDALSNALVWEFTGTGRGGEIVAPLLAADGAVYVCSVDGHAYALATAQGPRVLWKYPTSAAIRTGPALDPASPTLFLAGGDRRLHAVDRRTGAALWTEDLDDVPGGPAVVGDLVVAGTASGAVFARETSTGRPRWRAQVGGAVVAAPVAVRDLIVLGAGDGVLYALRARDGGKAWSYPTGGAIVGEAAISGDLVLVGSRDKNLYGLAAASGQIRWTFNRAGGVILSAPLAHGGFAYVGSDDGLLYALRAEDGQLLWRFKTDGPVRATPVLFGRRIFLGSRDRHVYALDID
jgi:outer membrane protein assembly factor BamB/tetratricopeptide (TPR) repeat protein